jgi:hypothetical protein
MFLSVIDGIFLALQAVLQLIPRPVASLALQHLSLAIDSSVNTCAEPLFAGPAN